MANYHLNASYVKRSEGKSSVTSAAYRARTQFMDEFRGRLTDDWSHQKDELEYSTIMLPENVPDWLGDRSTLWNTVEKELNRKNGQPALDVDFHLPRELSREKCFELTREFVQDFFVSKGLIADVNIHCCIASDGGENLHAHVLLTTRRWNEDGTMGKAARDLQDSPAVLQKAYALEQEGKLDEALRVAKGTNLIEWRKGWADYSNRFLDDSGSSARIDHRTLKAQAVDREATPNIGFAFHKEIDKVKGWLADRLEGFKAVKWRNSMRDQFERIRERRADLTAEFIVQAREYASELVQGLVPEDRDREHGRER